MKSDANPMQSAHDAPRCHATAKSTGEACKAPAVRGWRVCRVHGAGGGAPSGKAHPNYKHGLRSRVWTEMRKQINELVRMDCDSGALTDEEASR